MKYQIEAWIDAAVLLTHALLYGIIITLGNEDFAVWNISTDSTYLGAPHTQMNNRLAQSGQIFSQFRFFDFQI